MYARSQTVDYSPSECPGQRPATTKEVKVQCHCEPNRDIQSQRESGNAKLAGDLQQLPGVTVEESAEGIPQVTGV